MKKKQDLTVSNIRIMFTAGPAVNNIEPVYKNAWKPHPTANHRAPQKASGAVRFPGCDLRTPPRGSLPSPALPGDRRVKRGQRESLHRSRKPLQAHEDPAQHPCSFKMPGRRQRQSHCPGVKPRPSRVVSGKISPIASEVKK